MLGEERNGCKLTNHKLAFYAIPSAGVLAIELLKQHHAQDKPDAPLPRAEIIQQLSVLVWALQSVSSSDANYNTCAQGTIALQRVLDHVLESHPQPSHMSLQTDLEAPLVNIFDDFPLTIHDTDFMQLLGSN